MGDQGALTPAERDKRHASYHALNDKSALQRGRSALEAAEKAMDALENGELQAALYLRSVIQMTARNQPGRVSEALAARDNLRLLAARADSLAAKYRLNAQSLKEESAIADDLYNINGGLASCYFILAVSKVTDAIAQFYGVGQLKELTGLNEMTGLKMATQFKTVTNLKTPLSDIGKEAVKAIKGDPTLPPNYRLAGAQAVNVALTAGTGDDLKNLEEGVRSVIEGVKDLIGLYKAGKSMTGIRGNADKLSDLAVRFLDLISRIVTIVDIVDPLPKNNLVDKGLGPIKQWVNAGKYVLEAIVNLCSCVASCCDATESANAGAATRALANIQGASAHSWRFDPQLTTFATATDKTLTQMLYEVRSAADGARMRDLAQGQANLISYDFEDLARRIRIDNQIFEVKMQGVSALKGKLRETDVALEIVAGALKRSPDAGAYVVELLLRDIDDMHFRISRRTTPSAPRWIATHGKFGPRISTD
jgi:hypothetical protein